MNHAPNGLGDPRLDLIFNALYEGIRGDQISFESAVKAFGDFSYFLMTASSETLEKFFPSHPEGNPAQKER